VRYIFEHLGVAVFAITGALAAKSKRVDLFGVVVLALVTTLGGGTLRDLILGTPPFWTADVSFVFGATAAAIGTFFAARYWDAIGLPADGRRLRACTLHDDRHREALAFSGPNTVGVMTGVAGGIIRDVLTGEISLVFRAGVYLYATAAFCGAAVFVGVAPRVSPLVSQSIGVAVTLSLRLAAIRWRLGLPEFKTREKPPE